MAMSEVTVPPAAEPVDALEALAQLRLDDEAANVALFAPVLVATREAAEHELGRSLITQQRVLQLHCWPGHECGWGIVLDHPPVQTVDLVEYWDGAQWLVFASGWSLERESRLRHVLLPVDSWPGLGARKGPRVRVTYTAGFGDTAEAVPMPIRQWIVAMAGHSFLDTTGVGTPPSEHLNRQLDGWRTRI